jgi:putative ABC transport system ATP-binding protein
LAVEAIERLDLLPHAFQRADTLSGGQQQRVAIARALVTRPALLLADEPTGNLDSRTSLEVMALFQALNDEGVTVVLVTHEPDIARYTRRVVQVRDGRIVRDAPVPDRRRAADDLARYIVDAEDDHTLALAGAA